MSVYRQRGKRWAVFVKMKDAQGREHTIRKASPVNTKRGAQQFEQQVRQAVLDGTWGRPLEEPKAVPTLAEFSAEYMDRAATLNKPATVTTKDAMLRNHLLPYLGKRRLDDIRARDVDRLTSTLAKKLSPKSVNNVLNLLSNMLGVARDWELIAVVPKVHWLKVPKPEFRFLDFDEAGRLVEGAASEPEWQAMLTVALNTGMRLGELLALRWSDIDLKAGRLVVRQNVSRGIVGTPKNGRTREIPLNRRALAVLKGHRHLRGPLVFCAEDGRMLTKNECKWPLKRAQRKAGIIALGWHDLRHTFASHLVMRGVPMKAVQELLGHATMEMTMRYSHLSPNVKHDAVRALDEAPQDQHRINTGAEK